MLLQKVQQQEQSFFHVWKLCVYGGVCMCMCTCVLQLEMNPNFAPIVKLSNYELKYVLAA